MKTPEKTVAALHDLSGMGRCALTVVIPVISAMGVQVVPAPTAVYSAHTAFPDFVSLDLTDFFEATLSKWNEMGLKFDCVYSGYLAGVRQETIVRAFMEAQPQALRIVDPVLGDDGAMYCALPKDMPAAMARLCADADVITPNLTEAALLTGTEYSEKPFTHASLTELLSRLMDLKPKTSLLTGGILEDEHVNAWMGMDGRLHTYAYEPVPASFPGTGDLFASVLTGALTKGMPFADAVALATDYVRETMLVTVDCHTPPLHGVQLEQTLGRLCLHPTATAL